jgi:xyloglucan-specific endo-beta-1,4-glucanase
VKTYTNAALDFSATQLSSISSIPTVWDWNTVDREAGVYDVSYDMFLTSSPGAAYTHEIMVWVKAEGGAGPIGGQIATYSINGYTWDLHSGPNGATTVYSFVATTTITNVNFDLYAFYKTLISAGYVPASYYLAAGAIGAGTEPFTGSTILTTTAFSVAIN